MDKFTTNKKIIVVFIAALIFVVAATAVNINYAYSKSIEESKRSKLYAAKSISKNIEAFVKDEIRENEILTRTFFNINSFNMNLDDWIKMSFKKDILYSMGYINEDSKIIASVSSNNAPDSNLTENVYYRERGISEVLNEAINSRHTVVSNIISLDKGVFVFYIITPMYTEKGEYRGSVYRTVNLSYLDTDIVLKEKYGGQSGFFVLSADGTWLLIREAPWLIGKKYSETIDSQKFPLAYSNYSRISRGEEFSCEHEFPRALETNSKVDTVSRKILSCSPVTIYGTLLMSVGVSTPISVFSYIGGSFLNQILIWLAFILLIFYLVFRMYKMNMEHEKRDIHLREKIKNTNELDALNHQIRQMQFDVIKVLVNLMEMKDMYTAGHGERVTEYAVGFAEYIGYSSEQIITVKYAAILHDIGKIGVPEDILNKKSKLTESEINRIKEHPKTGFMAIKDIDFLHDVADVVLHHHERIDGKGYPDRLERQELSELSRILAICDSFDAMTSNRVYRKKLSFKEAFEEIEKNSGTQFDEQLAERFIEFMKDTYSSQTMYDAG